MKSKYIALALGVIVVIGGALWWSGQIANNKILLAWPDTDIPCLLEGHEEISSHIQASLKVIIQGQIIPIRANIGISEKCKAEVYTKDTSGNIHFESVVPGKTHTIADLFNVLHEEMQREGFTLTGTVNGVMSDDIASYTIQDGDALVLSYESTQPVTAQ